MNNTGLISNRHHIALRITVDIFLKYFDYVKTVLFHNYLFFYYYINILICRVKGNIAVKETAAIYLILLLCSCLSILCLCNSLCKPTVYNVHIWQVDQQDLVQHRRRSQMTVVSHC